MDLRLYESKDIIEIVTLFYQTVHTVNAADYAPAQLNAWASGTIDHVAWDLEFKRNRTFVAVEKGKILGFADMDEQGYLDRLYVHKDHQRHGVATMLCDALEACSKASCFETHASITAVPFFLNRGYRIVREQTVVRCGVVLHNVVMKKENEKEPR